MLQPISREVAKAFGQLINGWDSNKCSMSVPQTHSHLGWRLRCLSASRRRAPPCMRLYKGPRNGLLGGRVAWQPLARIRLGWQWFYSVHRPSAKAFKPEGATSVFLSGWFCADRMVQMPAHSGVRVHVCGKGFENLYKSNHQCKEKMAASF